MTWTCSRASSSSCRPWSGCWTTTLNGGGASCWCRSRIRRGEHDKSPLLVLHCHAICPHKGLMLPDPLVTKAVRPGICCSRSGGCLQPPSPDGASAPSMGFTILELHKRQRSAEHLLGGCAGGVARTSRSCISSAWSLSTASTPSTVTVTTCRWCGWNDRCAPAIWECLCRMCCHGTGIGAMPCWRRFISTMFGGRHCRSI